MVGGVDGLRQVAPAGQGRNALLAQELDGRQHVRAGRQQASVTERAQDAGVVGGGGAQLEQLAFGRGDGVVEQLAQLVGEAVEFLGGERALRAGAGCADETGGGVPVPAAGSAGPDPVRPPVPAAGSVAPCPAWSPA
ncbi:hypothetical protein GCM10020295_69790 [Streptomyces cinereospinus]